MGRGDRRTAKGKRFKHSFGNTRKRKKGNKQRAVSTTKKKNKQNIFVLLLLIFIDGVYNVSSTFGYAFF